MSPVQAISLDIDNTLFDRDCCAKIVFDAWLQRYSSTLDLSTIIAKDERGHYSRKSLFQWLEMELGIEDAFHQFQQELILQIKPNLALVSAIETMISKGMPVFILSDGGSIIQRKKLNRLGLLSILPESHLFISEETGHSKPSREAFLNVIHRASDYGINHTQSIMHIGDHWEKDILGSAQCMMTPVGIEPCCVESRHKICQDFITSVDELPAFLVSLTTE